MNKISVLIVEDDLKILEIHKMFVEKLDDFEIVGLADNIDDARKMVEILKPDLILLDLFFPKEHGLDFAHELRIKQEETDIILITAAQEIDTLKNAIRTGVFDYLIKPIMFPRFKKSLERYKEYKLKISSEEIIEQEFIDKLFVKTKAEIDNDSIPKGIDPITLKKIKKIFASSNKKGYTATEIGKMVGTSRSTARRYLEYLVNIDFLYTDHDYGTVGRPQRKYHKK